MELIQNGSQGAFNSVHLSLWVLRKLVYNVEFKGFGGLEFMLEATLIESLIQYLPESFEC